MSVRGTVTTAAGRGYVKGGPTLLPSPRAHARGQPRRVLDRARRAAALLPRLLPRDADRTRASAEGGAVHHRGQPPLVPGPVRDRDHAAPARLLRGQEGA